MRLHYLVPLAAFVLNGALVAISLLWNPRSRLHRLFAYFVSAMAVWNLGVFLLRRAQDPGSARFCELLIHVGVTLVPAFYYHFVLIFLDSTVRRRQWLVAAYGVCGTFFAMNLAGSKLFISDMRLTEWGWAPVPGPFYYAFLIVFYGLFLVGLTHLAVTYRHIESGFRRNRTRLIFLGTTVAITGGFIDIVRFALASRLPVLERIYPLGIPTNMVCAVVFGTAIIRYRLFDVNAAVKKCVVYGTVGAAVTSVLMGLTWVAEQMFHLEHITAFWILGPLGFVFALLLSPLGRPAEDWIERLMFNKPRGCHDTLVALSQRTSMMLNFDQVVDTLVRELVHGIPVTHGCLLVQDRAAGAFVACRSETISGERVTLTTLRPDSAIAEYVRRSGSVLIKDQLTRRHADDLDLALQELDMVGASLIVPIRIERNLIGILALGEKVSGEIFDAKELELLSVLANQAAISLENARLYERAERERRELEVLYELSRRLVAVTEPEAMMSLIVDETRRLLGVEFAGLRLLDGEDLILKASTDSSISHLLRPRLRVGESLSGLVVANNAPVNVGSLLQDERYDPAHRRAAAAAGLLGFLGVPIRSEGRAAGALYVYTKRSEGFDVHDVSLLASFADQVALMLQKTRLAEERQRAEEALRQSEKVATMGQLLAGVAHELNNPLTVITGYASFLGTKLAETPLVHTTEQIEIAAQRCSRIVRNFLSLARRHPPERRVVALNQVVTAALELLEYPLGIDNVTTALDLAADLPALWADPHQLQQVLVNLLTNAHYALRQTTARELTVTTRYDASSSRVVLRVADTGPGIPAKIRGKIFEPFFTTKPVGQGTGLGLSLCAGIVESHGGSIRVESEEGQGTVFTVALPVGPSMAGDDQSASERSPRISPQRILVVDDEAAVTDLLRQMLAVDGHHVDAVHTAMAALAKLDEHPYDLVVADIRMPRLDGSDLYREVTRRFVGRAPRFVFITGDLVNADTLKFLEATKAPCLHKPFGPEDLQQALAAAQRSHPSSGIQ